jgi:hypothetical protein
MQARLHVPRLHGLAAVRTKQGTVPHREQGDMQSGMA